MYAGPMYENIPGRPLEYATTILACIAVLVTLPIYVFYRKGSQIREKSKSAQSFDQGRSKRDAKRRESMVGNIRDRVTDYHGVPSRLLRDSNVTKKITWLIPESYYD